MSNDNRLLAAIGLHMTGNLAASDAYSDLLGRIGPRDPAATPAAVLHAMCLADQNRVAEGEGALKVALQNDPAPLEKMLLQLHLSLHRLASGDLEGARRANSIAVQEKRISPQSVWRALHCIARHNQFTLNHLAGQFEDPRSLPLRGSELPLLRSAVDISIGLTTHLHEQFDAATKDPSTQTVVWRQEDPIEVRLQSAFLRARILGDLGEQRDAQKLLGRFHILANLGSSNGVPQVAFQLLRCAWDEKGLRAAARASATRGPVGSLAVECEDLVSHDWPKGEWGSVLALLAEGSALISAPLVDDALRRIRSTPEMMAASPDECIRAIASLLEWSTDKAHSPASRFAREIVSRHPTALILQRIGRVVAALRWSALSASERDAWAAFVRAHLLGESDFRILAEEVASALTSTDGDPAQEALLDAYQDEPDLRRLAVLLNVGLPIPPKVRRSGIDRTVKSLIATRSDAARGSFGFGGIDAAQILFLLLKGRPRHEAWSDLAGFLLDERVAINDKTQALSALAADPGPLPADFRSRMESGLRSLGGTEGLFGDTQSAITGAKLRLALKLGICSQGEALSTIAELSGASDPNARREAARILPAGQELLGDDIAFTFAVTLMRDQHIAVRAHAGRYAAQLNRETVGEIGGLAVDRMIALLGEPGVDVPYWVLAGVDEAQRSGIPPTDAMKHEIHRVERSHPSRAVQDLAAFVLRYPERD